MTAAMPPLAGWEDYERDPLPVVLSVSGGKDSTALGLALKARGVPFRAVFANTGWEHPETLRFVRDVVPALLGVPVVEVAHEPILPADLEPHALELEAMLGFRSPFVRRVLRSAAFPSRSMRWCTQDLKIYPLAMYTASLGEDVYVATGIRAEESARRATWPVWETMVVDLKPPGHARIVIHEEHWRPVLDWTEGEIIEVLRDYAGTTNPLYLAGARRVGCWPCINAGRGELRLLAEDDTRIAVIRRLEDIVALWHRRRCAEPGLHGSRGRGLAPDTPPRMFQSSKVDAKRGYRPFLAIDEALSWAKEQPRRAGQMDLLWNTGSGCARWGLCPSSGPPKVGDYGGGE